MVIGDVESKYLWDYFEKSKFDGIDLIISCGDLNPVYLSFLVTMTSLPVLYVHGNHDDRYEKTPPEGCTCIEDQIYVYNGVRILGLGGSMRYKKGNCQYTQLQMWMRVVKLRIRIFLKGGFDILVTHAPAYQVNSGDDLPHQGFRAFNWLLDKYQPKFFLHGHVHLNYGRKYKRHDQYGSTHVINAYERCVFEYEDETVCPR